jgi:hypothetical protein
MKARWTMAATLFAVAAAMLVLAGAAAAQPPSQTGQVFHIDETYIDPYLSFVCGFDVLEHDVGVLQFTSSDDRSRERVSVRQTLTNPETGTSVVVLQSSTEADRFVLIDENGSHSYRYTFTGLNYKVLGADGADISAGRFFHTFTVIVDENGNLVSDTQAHGYTPHLSHFFGSSTEAVICDTLAQ